MAIQFRDSDGTTRLSGDLLASGGATGDVLTQQADGTYAPATGGLPNPFVVTGTDPNQVVAKFVAAAAQGDDLLDVVAAPGVEVLTINETGTLSHKAYDNALTVIKTRATFGQSAIDLEANDGAGATVAAFTVAADGVTTYDGNFNKLTGTLASGAVIAGSHAAPADGDLSAGECCLWFDQTNGAAKLMIKAKSANGTVVTGTVALA